MYDSNVENSIFIVGKLLCNIPNESAPKLAFKTIKKIFSFFF